MGHRRSRTPCARCNTHCTVLFLVRRDIGVRAAAMVDSASRQRIRELMSDGRVSASHPTRVALCNIYKDQGIHTCFTCASGAMAESFARQQTPSRRKNVDALLREAAWMQRRASLWVTMGAPRCPQYRLPASEISDATRTADEQTQL